MKMSEVWIKVMEKKKRKEKNGRKEESKLEKKRLGTFYTCIEQLNMLRFGEDG